MAKRRSNDSKIVRETGDLTAMLLLFPDNPIPWAAVISVVAPVVARLAVRMALKRLDRGLSEEKVNQIGSQVGKLIRDIVRAKLTEEGK